MKKLSFSLVFLFVSFSLFSQIANTRLWRISGNGLTKPSYLFGSMHVDDERVFNFSDSLFYALASCEVFANEVSVDSVVKFLYESIDSKFHEKMEDAYFGDDDEALDELSQTTGLDKSSLKKISPVVLKEMINGLSRVKNQKPAVLDSYLYNIARREGKICIGIENLSDQIDVFDKFPEYLKKDYADYSIGKKRNDKNLQLVEVYRKADLKAVETLMKQMPTDIFKVLFTDRNLGMAQQIDSISRIHSAFYTIGFGHLPGEEGLIFLLKNKGFKVDPVLETFTGMADKFPFSNKELPWNTFSDSKTGYAVDMPGQWYTSPNFPLGLTHGLLFDLGTNSFYMTAARSSSAFSSVSDLDSLTQVFVSNGWKINVPKDKIHTVFINGQEFRQIDKLKKDQFYLSLRLAIQGENLYLMIGLNNQEKEMGDFNRFFNSFRLIDKIANNWNTFSSENGGYEVSFPGNPKENIIENKNEESRKTIIGMINSVDNTTGNEFLVQYLDNPKLFYPSDSLVLALLVKSTVASLKYTSLISKDTLFEGFPAVQFTCKLESGQTFRVLAIVRGTRIYNLLTSETTSKNDSSQASLFFNSFKFKKYDWQNWTTHTSDVGYFNALSPTDFEQVIEMPDNKIYTKSESYYSFDKLTGDKILISRKVFSPYYQSDCDSAFFRKCFSEQFGEDDSIIIEVRTGQKPYSCEYSSISLKNHLLTKTRYLLDGRSLYSAVSMFPRIYESINPGTFSVENFSVNDTTTPGDVKANKTQKLLEDLKSGDTLLSYPARDALSFYKFSKEEMPQVWQTFHQPFNDDTLLYSGTRVLLLDCIDPVLDSTNKEILIASFDTVCTNNSSKLNALSLLTKDFDVHYQDFVKKKLLQIPANTIYKYKVISLLYDSVEYCLGMFPEILDMLNDSLNRDDVINITAGLLRTDKMPVSRIESYKDEIIALMNSILSEEFHLSSYDYYTPKIFLVAGYFNDSQINTLLQKNHNPKNQYVAYNILKALINNNLKASKKDITRIAEDVNLRGDLYAFLDGKGKTSLMNEKYRSQQAIAESDFYEYMTMEDYNPEKLGMMGFKDIIYNDTLQRFYMFRFENEYDDEREIDISVAGPYPTDNSIPENRNSACGAYWSTDRKLTVKEHFDKFIEDLNETEQEKDE